MKDNNALMVLDEIQTGYGRLGANFAWQFYGLDRPDLITIGKAMSACADNPDAASLVGINVNRINSASFALGAATTAAAGVLLLPLMPLSPHLGHDFTLTAFIVVILGGMGNLLGALVGGLILGVAESVSTLFLPATLKHAVSFSILIIIMLFRPQGLLGGKK